MSDQAAPSPGAGLAHWKPYPDYKESGLEWLGEIPARWDTRPLKALAPFVSRGNGPDYVNDSRISVVNQACIYWDGLHLESVKYQEEVDVSGWKGLLHHGDLILNSTGTGTLGRAALFEGHQGTFIADSHVTIVRLSTQGMSPQYAFYLVQTQLYQGYIYAALVSGSTNQIELSREKLRATPVILPPLPEQRAVVEFLDRETAKIDALIAKKARLIELLQEKRTALISHAVTKGLDPSVPMKDSGIEWLGEIPAHWEVNRLKYAAGINQDLLSEDTDPAYSIYYVDIGNVDSTGRILDIQELIFDTAPSRARRRVRPGDTIISTVRTYLKAIAFLENPSENLIVSTGFATLSPKDDLSGKFLWYLVQSAQFVDAVVAHSEGVSYPAINPNRLGCLPAWIPSVPEQKATALFLDSETAEIDGLVTKVHEAIDRLREYRTALISAAVTGKIDVREATP